LRDVLNEVVAALPAEVHPNIIIIGSLAAGYGLFRRDDISTVRTKDVDCVLSPHLSAVEKGKEVAEKLIAAGWSPKSGGQFGQPGTRDTPIDQLPAVRLYPPSGGEWFIELLTEPASENQTQRKWAKLPLTSGHFQVGLCVHAPRPAMRCFSPLDFADSHARRSIQFGLMRKNSRASSELIDKFS
jgi:hypothetical protein